MMKAILVTGLVAALPFGAFAKDIELPSDVYDAFANISLATTAKTECAGAKVSDAKIQKAGAAVMKTLIGTGLDPMAAVKHLETPAGVAQIHAREVALRNKHGVPAEGIDGLCAAIKAEGKSNKALRKLVKIR